MSKNRERKEDVKRGQRRETDTILLEEKKIKQEIQMDRLPMT